VPAHLPVAAPWNCSVRAHAVVFIQPGEQRLELACLGAVAAQRDDAAHGVVWRLHVFDRVLV